MKNILLASALASAVTLAAVLFSIADSASSMWRDDSIAACCDYLSGDRDSIKLHEMHHAPGYLQDAVWSAWSARCKAASAPQPVTPAPVADLSYLRDMADEDDIAAADSRLLEFVRGFRSHVAEDDLAIGTPALVETVYRELD